MRYIKPYNEAKKWTLDELFDNYEIASEKYLSKIEDLDECLVILHLRDHREFAFNLLNTRFSGYSAQRNFYYPVNTDMFVLSPKQGHWSKLFSFLVLRYCNRLLYMQTLEEKEKFYEEQLQEQN